MHFTNTFIVASLSAALFKDASVTALTIPDEIAEQLVLGKVSVDAGAQTNDLALIHQDVVVDIQFNDGLDVPGRELKEELLEGEDMVVKTSSGAVRGKIQKSYYRTRQFLGIPYAQPPVDGLRFEKPQPVKPWDGVLQAVTSGDSCPQVNILERMSEDCLYLDVMTPTADRIRKHSEPLPVMIWIHGGSFIFGSGSFLSLQNPRYMVHHKNVIVVAINYRLGPLGFLVTDSVKGNMGLLDQRLAIQWVKENIGNFGGDGNKITLWGQSAGAMSISHHLTMPNSHGLFQKAIMQSGVFGIRSRTLDEARSIGEMFADKVGCQPQDIECMRAVPLYKIMIHFPISLQNRDRFFADLLLWAPVVDGFELVGQPSELIDSGHYDQSVQVMMGINKDEAGLLAAQIDLIFGRLIGRRTPSFSDNVYSNVVQFIFRDQASSVLDLYPAHGDIERNLDNIVDLASDYMAVCPTERMAKNMAKFMTSVHVYSFEFAPVFMPDWFMKRCEVSDVCHGMELPYVFHSLQDIPFLPKFSVEEHTMSHLIVDYWADFASAYGSASSGISSFDIDHDDGVDQGSKVEVPVWPWLVDQDSLHNHESHKFTYMEFNQHGAKVKEADLRANQCPFWDSVGNNY